MQLHGHIWQEGSLKNVILILDHHVPNKTIKVLNEEGEMDIGELLVSAVGLRMAKFIVCNEKNQNLNFFLSYNLFLFIF